MRVLLAVFALGLIVACSAKTPAASGDEAAPGDIADAKDESAAAGDITDVTSGEPKTIEDMRAESLASVDQAACAAAGGEVRQEGMLGMYRCVTPYADAGKECRSGDECEGKCLSTGDAMTGEEGVGACQANDSPFGCYAEIEDGKVTHAICVD